MERPTFSASNMKTWTGCAWNISFLCWYGADGEESQLRTSLISYTSIVNFSMVSWFNILNQLKGWMIGCCCLLNYIFTSCIVARLEKVHLKEVKKMWKCLKACFNHNVFAVCESESWRKMHRCWNGNIKLSHGENLCAPHKYENFRRKILFIHYPLRLRAKSDTAFVIGEKWPKDFDCDFANKP